jgi:hypothetical protein
MYRKVPKLSIPICLCDDGFSALRSVLGVNANLFICVTLLDDSEASLYPIEEQISLDKVILLILLLDLKFYSNFERLTSISSLRSPQHEAQTPIYKNPDK